MFREEAPCPFCGQPTALIHVAGHYQCDKCHQVVEGCCQGESVSITAESGELDTG